MKKYLVTIMLSMVVVGTALAQMTEVPIEFVKGCIFVNATVDGVSGKYFLDTGAPMALTHARAQEGDYAEIGRMPIVDVFGNKTDGIPVVVINQFDMGQFRMPPGGLQVLVAPEKDPMGQMLGVDGIVGCNFLSRMVVRIDTRQGKMIFSGSVEPYGLREEDGIAMRVGPAGHVFVTVDLGGGISEEMMFDTGSSDFVNLAEKSHARLQATPAFESVATVRGAGSRGAAGGEALGYIRGKIGELNVGRGRFVDVMANVLTGGPVSLLGTELARHGVITLDYPRRCFYFEPFDDEPVNAYEAVWDIKIMSDDGQLKVATVWDGVDTRVEPGDMVMAVDGIGYEGHDTLKFIDMQREGTNTERQITVRKEDGTEFTVTSRRK